MPGFLRVDRWDAISQGRVSEYLDETRSIAGLIHIVDATCNSGRLAVANIGRFEASLDRESEGGGSIGRFQTGLSEVFTTMTQDLFGNAKIGQVAGGDTDVVFFQPFAIPPFGRNAINVSGIKELKYTIDWHLNAADLDTYEHRVYAVVTDDVPEAYIPHIDQKSLDFTGANDQDDVTFQGNVTHAVIEDVQQNLGELRVVRNGETVLEDIPVDNNDLPRMNHVFANADNAHEDKFATYPVFLVDLLQGSSPESSLAQTVNIEGEAVGAGDVNVFAVQLDFENARDDSSLAATLGRFERAIQRAENLPTGEARQELPQPILRPA